MRLASILITSISLGAPAANAQSVADLFRKHDLFGTWAVYCSQPSGIDPVIPNVYVVYRLLDADRVET
jgi:hypothetical protein